MAENCDGEPSLNPPLPIGQHRQQNVKSSRSAQVPPCEIDSSWLDYTQP
ncbi:hypothetical protein [Leptothoe kymatousa]|uniref:Uncharacterized protein n=1 Tax=Leptothoe kymatousa TAU-MAC 1615 TaxID=2364775 RepID=A0ABS5Y3G1_9CYAN|nr:hypothetical protein [Leptothoe kymatousa]MBT9311909.1 hypothetical protein [Leptothoe kymatousa TAU-MAC 1615]